MQGSTVDEAKIALNYRSAEATVHHGAHADHRIFGVVMFLVAESMIFLGLFSAFLIYRSVTPRLAA